MLVLLQKQMMTPKLIDSHCHLHFPAYDEDRDAVLMRMNEQRVWAITVGTNATTSRGGIAFAESHIGIFATVGYHPEHLTSSFEDENEPGSNEPFSIDQLSAIAKSSKKVVAIGETGLDYYRIDKDRDVEDAAQQQVFALREHLALAHELGLPAIFHCRNAFHKLAEVVQSERENGRRVQGVVHCFTGSWDEAKPLLDLGLHLSFTGIITFPPKKTDDVANSVLRVIENMPLERLLIETDAPWLTPVPHRGERNEPPFVQFVAHKVAALRGIGVDEVARQSTENAMALFALEFHN